MKIGIIAGTLSLLAAAAPAQASETPPGLCGAPGKNGLALTVCAKPAARSAGRLLLQLDPQPARPRRADPLGTGELGRRQLNQLIASL